MDTKPPAAAPPDRIQTDKVQVVQQEGYSEDYANSVQVNVSVWDFFLQFGRLKMDPGGEVTFASFHGVYMSPQQAKALHLVLAQNVAQYETTFGKIQIDNPQGDQAERGGLVQ